MKALLKRNNEWVDIDTRYLFNDQYNTAGPEGVRIFDKDIIRIEDDARIGMGKCHYCGALVKMGEEEKHFAERESKTCEDCGNGKKCFWYQPHRIGENIIEDKEENVKTERGHTVHRVKTIEYIEEMRCTYNARNDCKTDCTNKECRAYGIEWFTPANTFFLAFPNGFSPIPFGILTELDARHAKEISAVDREQEFLSCYGFFKSGFFRFKYYKRLGSYNLYATPFYDEDGKMVAIDHFTLSNCKCNVDFCFVNGELYTKNWSTWRRQKVINLGMPEKVMDQIRKICGGDRK